MGTIRTRIRNIKEVLKHQKYLLLCFSSSIILLMISLYLTKIAILIVGLGTAHTVASIILDVLLSLLFGLNVALMVYKFDSAKKTGLKEGGTVFSGAFLGSIASGCPACSVTLASLLGLTGFILTLPFKGLEFKVLGIVVLGFSTAMLSKNMECKECFCQKLRTEVRSM
ncbi:MAG TPA: hypothetical protein VI894_00165 [Candidatus Nanoarchaeia archaeon]|nr:hypothetical protein [Candidatus Nanoarchaeia archaeon]